MNLKIERIKRGMSQVELSKISGVSIPIIIKIEKGDIDHVTLGSLRRISEVLNVSMTYLFFEKAA